MPLHDISFTPTPRRLDPSRGWLLLLTVLLFLLPGTLQRDPWKMEDASHFGVVWRALASGDWTYFHFSQSALAEPPLYYWAASISYELLHGLLTPPAAIRFATAAFVALSAVALLASARRFYGPRMAGAAPLALIGCLGLLIASHDIQPMTAVLGSICVLLLGISRAESPLTGGLLIALGVGGTLLGSGLRLAPVLLIALATGLVCRRRGKAIAVTIGLAGGGALFALWWMALHRQSPEIALTWFAHQMQLLKPGSDAASSLWEELVTLSWFAWPAWPLAAYALWVRRHRLDELAYRTPLVMGVAALLVLGLATEIRQSWFILVLPPLALLAVPGVEVLRRGGESLLDWFGRMTFGLFLVVLLLGWSAMIFGWPEKWAAKSARWAPGFVGTIEPVALLLALACIGAWLWICFRQPRSPLKSLFAWSGGLTTFWFVIVALWLPWFDHQRSFRNIALAALKHLPDNACVVSREMGEAQFALFDYYLPNRLYRRPPHGSDCKYALTQGSPSLEIAPEGNWKRIWEGARPGDRVERYRLYVRP